MISCTEKGLQSLINEGKPVVVIAHTDWCCECRRVLPMLKEIEPTYNNKVVFADIDADNLSDDYIKKYGVEVLPTINFVTKDRVHSPCTDLNSKDSIIKYIDACLS